MKARTVLFFTLLTLVTAFSGARSAMSSAEKGLESFLGEWEGTWLSTNYNKTGGVDITISSRPDDDSLKISGELTGTSRNTNSFLTTGKLKEGRIVVDRPSFKLELHLVEGDRLEGPYNVVDRDRGYWSLTRKKK